MKEKDDNLFYDISGISETSGIRERATVEYMNAALRQPPRTAEQKRTTGLSTKTENSISN